MTRKRTLAVALPAVVALLMALPAMRGGFVFDDLPIVRDNDRIHDLARVPELLRDNYWGERGNWHLYRPTTLTAFALEWAVSGGRPEGFHAVNALVYALCTALLAAVALRLGATPLAAAAGALLFAVHPIHVEAVAPAVGLSELLAAAFVLAGLLAVLGAPARATAPLAAICLFLAVTSKENGIVLVALLAWMAAFPSEPGRGARRLATGVAVVLVLGVWLWLRSPVVSVPAAPQDFVDNPLADRTATARVAGALHVLLHYHEKALLPWPLSFDYSYRALDPDANLRDPRVLLSAGLLILLAAAAWTMRRRPLPSLGLVLYAAALLPASNLLFASGTIFGERLLFLPSAGLCLAGAGLVQEMRAPGRRGVTLCLVGVLAATGAVLFQARLPDWRTEERLFRSAVQVQPQSCKARLNLAAALLQRASSAEPDAQRALRKEAAELLRSAVAIHPDYLSGYHNLALAEEGLGDRPAALEARRQTVRLAPRNAAYQMAYADALGKAGRADEGLESIQESLRLEPGNADAWQVQGRLYVALRQPQRAAGSLQRSLDLDPGNPDVVLLYAQMLHLENREAELRGAVEQLLAAASPAVRGKADTWRDLGGLTLALGAPELALACFERATARRREEQPGAPEDSAVTRGRALAEKALEER